MANQPLSALKLVLDTAGVGTDISTVDRRKLIQKTIHIAKSYGIDLGYSFSWYVKGAYSTSLTQDYYELARGNEIENLTLKPFAQQIIDTLRNTIINSSRKPVGLSREDWMELVSSYRYLSNEHGLDEESTLEKLRREKPHVVDFINEARMSLNDCDQLLRETNS